MPTGRSLAGSRWAFCKEIMYSHTIQEKNGDGFTPINFYMCDICGGELCECGGSWMQYNKIDICTDCGERIFADTIKSTHWISALLLLKSLECKYFNKYRKKRISLPKYIRQKVLNKYKFTCQICGRKNLLSIDHIKPVKHGGTDDIKNLQVLCRYCNSKKNAKWKK